MYAEGAVVGEYTLQRKLGHGPLAEVWRAKKADRPDPVALKLLRPGTLSSSAAARAFEQLVGALSETGRLEHPHLPAALGTVRRPSDGLFGIACAYFDGGPLFDAGDLTDPAALYDALELVIQLGQTVMWLHDQGLVHGAIKPSNVLASPSADGPSVRLLDLSWARAGLCRLEGTRFEPPELTRGPPTVASDQWAVARLVRVLVARHAPEPVGAWARAPSDLRKAVDRSLAQNPQDRFGRVADLVDALVAAQVALSSSAPTYPARPDELPAPTVPVPQQRPPTLEPSVIDPELDSGVHVSVDPTANPGIAGSQAPLSADAPTEPGMTDAEQAQIRQLAGGARTVGVPVTAPFDPTTPGGLGDIDPSADSETPSRNMPSVTRPADPTTPLEPAHAPPPRGGISLPVVVALAVLGTAIIYAWSLTTTRPEDIVQMAEPTNAGRPAQIPIPPAPPPLEPVKSTDPKPDVPDAAVAKPPPRRPPASPPPQNELPRKAARTVDVEAKDHAWGDCRSGVKRACLALANQHERLKHWRAAAKAREQACLQGHRSSCTRAAEHFLKIGEGRKARRRYEQLCDNRVGSACSALANLFQKGIGGAANPRTAKAFRLRACKLGHRPSCSR